MISDNFEMVEIRGRKIYAEYYRPYENRPTLVFLHDSLGCVSLWRDLPRKLGTATKCNVLVYDRLGYGNSEPMPTCERSVNYLEHEADLLNELLSGLNIRNTVLIGHSDGGTIALLAASKYPDKVASVIVEAAHIFVEEVTLKGICAAMDAYKDTDLPERLAKYHGDKVETLFRAWTETWTRRDYRTWNIEHFLSGIKAPLLFIQGEADEYGTLEQVDKTIRQVGGKAEKLVICGVGHTPHKECPELFFDAAKRFISG